MTNEATVTVEQALLALELATSVGRLRELQETLEHVTTERNALVADARRHGLSLATLAALLDVTPGRVQQMAKEGGWEPGVDEGARPGRPSAGDKSLQQAIAELGRAGKASPASPGILTIMEQLRKVPEGNQVQGVQSLMDAIRRTTGSE